MRKIALLLTMTLLILGACGKDLNETNNNEQNNQNNIVNNISEEVNNTDDQDIQDEQTDKEENDTAKEEEVENVEPQYEINEVWSVVPITEEAKEKVVLLTIDDAPENYAVEMAETLDKLDTPAIFFVNGHFLETEEDKEKLRKIHDLGFAIGNHTYSHANLAELSKEEQREEIVSVNDMVEEIIGERPIFFRPPFGSYGDETYDILTEENMTYMNWTYGYDWEAEYMSEEAIADIMINTELLNPGANLLMHDREWTKDALADIVQGLRDKGYDFVEPKIIKQY